MSNSSPTQMTWTETFYLLFQTPMVPVEPPVAAQTQVEGIPMHDLSPPPSVSFLLHGSFGVGLTSRSACGRCYAAADQC